MTTLAELMAQKAALEALIAETREKELAGAIAQVKALIEAHGLTSEDIFGGKKPRAAKKTGTVAAKYRDPISGSLWTGRGLPPKWLAGKNKEDYLIAH